MIETRTVYEFRMLDNGFEGMHESRRPRSIVHMVHGDADMNELLERFKDFLLACGFVVTGDLQEVDEFGPSQCDDDEG